MPKSPGRNKDRHRLQPLRSGGKLTVSDLAAEAGIKRWISPTNTPDLIRQSQAEFTTLGRVPGSPQAALDPITKLETQLANARSEKQHLTGLVNTYAAIINQLSNDLADVER